MKALKVVGGVIGVALVALFGMAAMQPDQIHVERSVVVAAAPVDAFAMVNDLAQWQKWNPWMDMDPNQTVTLSETTAGKDAWYEWKGEKSGAGKMTITESVPNERVVEDLAFTAPFASTAVVSFTFVPEGESTKVTWSFDQENKGMHRVMGVLMDMDAMLGADFDKGLGRMKPMAEAEAGRRKEAEAAAAKAAAEAAEAVAAETAVADAPAP